MSNLSGEDHGDYYNSGPNQLDMITVKYSQTIGITPISNNIPKEYKLFNNFPNPFNPYTNIQFNLPIKSKVNLIIFDTLGKVIEIHVNYELNAGSYSVRFDGTMYSSGVYFCKFIANEKYSKTIKLL